MNGTARAFRDDRGVLDRAGEALGSDSGSAKRELRLTAQRKLDGAARAEGRLLPTREPNTERRLPNLAHALGHRARFAQPPL